MGGWAVAHLRSKLSYNKKHTRNEKRPILRTTPRSSTEGNHYFKTKEAWLCSNVGS